MSEQIKIEGTNGDRILVMACLLLLAVPGLSSLGVDMEQRGEELRRRERRPVQGWQAPAAIKDKTGWAEKAYSDRLGLRTPLLQLRSLFHWGVLGQAPGTEMVRGKGGWLFLDYGRHLDNWRGAAPMSDALLQDWVKNFLIRKDSAEAGGSKYIVCLLPGKPSIYPERIPERFARVGPSRRDQLMSALREAGVSVRDLLPSMLAGKAHDSQEQWDFMVHPTGTHWSGRGERVAEAWLRAELEIEPVRVPWVRRKGQRAVGDSWTTRLYLDGLAPFSDLEWWTVQAPDMGTKLRNKRFSRQWKNGERRFHMNNDSYGRGVRDLLGRNIWLRSVWEHSLDGGRTRTSQAEVVVDWFVERILDDLVPSEFMTSTPADMERAFARGESSGWSLEPGNPGTWRVLGEQAVHQDLEQPGEILAGVKPATLFLDGLPELEQDCVLELDLVAPGFGGVEVGVVSSPKGLKKAEASQCVAHLGGRRVLHVPILGFKLKRGDRLQVLLDCGPGTYVLHRARLRKVEPLRGLGLRAR
ncbi:MAG: hypothetical protein ABGY32_02295 [bacterium]